MQLPKMPWWKMSDGSKSLNIDNWPQVLVKHGEGNTTVQQKTLMVNSVGKFGEWSSIH